MHTVKQANELYCPVMPRHIEETHVGGGFTRKYETPSHCVGNRCAMWRWIDESHHKSYGAGIDEVKLGFCGLAGKQPK